MNPSSIDNSYATGVNARSQRICCVKYDGELSDFGGDNDLPRLAAAIYLLNKLCRRLMTGFRIARIDGDNFRMQKLHQRRTAHARQLKIVDTLLLQILACAQREGIRGADQRGGVWC